MAPELLSTVLRCGSPQEVYQHLKSILGQSSEDDVTSQLVEYVGIGFITPHVFMQWLCIAPNALRQALSQHVSIKVRQLAIKSLRKRLKPSRWDLTWEHIGGVRGWLDLLLQFSVVEVKETCRTIGHSAWGPDRGSKREKITQLFKALNPHIFPESPERTVDRRSLGMQYRHLLPACIPEVVNKMFGGQLEGMETGIPNGIRVNLLHIQSDTLQSAAIDYVFQKNPVGKEWLPPLLHQYPQQSTTQRKGFSASMEFSLHILDRLAHEKSLLSSEYCIDQIVLPLLKRTFRKNVDWSYIRHVVDLTVKFLKSHPEQARKLNCRPNGLIHLVAKCWSLNPDIFEASLEFLLTRRLWELESVSFETFEQLLGGVPMTKRYNLLRKCFTATVDIDIDNEMKLCAKEWFLSYTLLTRLPAKDALGLFERVRSVQGGSFAGLAPSGDHILSFGSSFEDRKHADNEMWHVFLLRRAGQVEMARQIAKKCIEERKRESKTGSTPERRAFYANSVFHFAVASESLELFNESHTWAQRFLGDYVVVKTLYQSHLVDTRKFVSGILSRLDQSLTSSALQERIVLANRIISGLFDTACLALRQPSFTEQSWHGTLCLPLDAVRHRIERSKEIQAKMNLSEEELYEVIWKDTLRMLLAVEEKTLIPGYARLHAGTIRGILDYRNDGPTTLADELPSTYRFLDNLAQARDELWRKHRAAVHPTVAALPSPFPRGLPIQHLTEPFILDSPYLETFAPYLTARRDSALYMDTDMAQTPIPTEKKTQDAIGVFIDDYYFALRMLVPNKLTKEELERRLEQAWAHAVGALCQGRMNRDEAVRYWRREDVFSVLSHHEEDFGDWPRLPDFDGSSETRPELIWNPRAGRPDHIEKRMLETVTYIDISKKIGWLTENLDPQADVRSTMVYSEQIVPGLVTHDVWSYKQIELGKKRTGIREAQIMSSLMYLDSLTQCKPNVFADAFPSADQTRYPAAILHDKFSSDPNLNQDRAIEVLSAHLEHVPPPLLARLVGNATASLGGTSVDAAEYADVERMAMSLIRLLGRSDRPRLAIEFAVRVILQYPNASSWFRRIISPGFFRRLSAQDVRSCIASLADGILEVLSKRTDAMAISEDEGPTEAEEEEGKTKTFAKVTTVKYLAQLLGDSEIVPEAFAIPILEKLNKFSSHVDVRRGVMDSLLKKLKMASESSAEQSFEALESMIPILGNIRERQPVDEKEWARSSDALELPSLKPTYSLVEDAPMLASLLKFLKDELHADPNFVHSAALMKRVVLPVVEHLKKETKRWVSIFLRKHGYEETSQKELRVPSLPWNQAIWTEVMRCALPHLPSSFLDEYIAYIRYHVEPWPPRTSFLGRLRSNAAVRDSPEVQNFLTRFGGGPSNVRENIRSLFMELLLHPSELTGEITIKTVQEQFLKLYTSLLWNDTPKLNHLDFVAQTLWSFHGGTNPPAKWEETHQPIVEAMILYVEGLRTREWQRDPQRRPTYLPDTFIYRMWILQAATRHTSAGDLEEHCKSFADRVSKISNAMAGTIYHGKLKELQKALKYLRGECRARVACYLGDITKTTLSWLSQPDILRVEVAAELLQGCRPRDIKDGQLKAKIRELKDSWRQSESEEVRRLGLD